MNRGDLSTQWSPIFYHPERLKYLDIFLDKNYKFKIDKLKYLIDISSKKSTASKVDKYVGMANISSNTGFYIESENEKGKGDCSVFQKSNVLFGKLRPYLNKVYFAEFNGGCTTEFIVMNSLNEDVISNKFLSIFVLLDCVVNQTKYMMTGNTLPRLQTFDIENLILPIPPKIIQQNIINIMDNAYKLKKQKEQEAKDLLSGIDDYLLDKLGIELPQESDNNIESRTFRVEFSDVFNNRVDAPFYKKMYKDNLINIKKSTFKPLKNIAIFSSETWNQKDTFTDTFPYVEISEINLVDGSIENINYIKLKDAPSRAKMIVRNNDIIVSTTRPARGAISLIQTDTKLIASTGFVVIRTIDKEVITKEYLFRILKSKYILMQFEQRSSGGNYPAITQDEMKKVIIPIPLLSLQNEITEYIQNTLNKAKILQNEATEELKKAKEEVEKIILGKNYGT